MTFIEHVEQPRPLYIFAKLPPDTASLADRVRRLYGIATAYAPELFHITLARLGESRNIAPSTLARIDDAVASLRIEPCSVVFDRIQRNMLTGGKGLSVLRAEQRALVSRFAKYHVPIMPSTAQPHVSLAYNAPVRPDIAIVPIGWRIEELVLVVSHHGEARHEVLRRWPLNLRQLTLPFAA